VTVTLTAPCPAGGCRALVILTAQTFGSTGNSAGFMTVELDNDITTALDANSLRVFGNDPIRASSTSLITGLSAGNHTFTAVYRQVGSGTATFSARNIVVIPG
jgi:hypothetical protein